VTQYGTLELDLDALSLPMTGPFQLLDLLDGASYTWRGARNGIELDPTKRAAHLFWIQR